jgi:glycosyltransferase involved in cell wall biosynthesis
MGSKVILDIHDLVPEFYASKFGISHRSLTFRLLVWIEKLSSIGSNHVIISNHLWYTTLTGRSVKPARCTAIINYPDLSLFYRRPRSSQTSGGDFVLCYPGTLNRHQGLDVAINAVAIVRKTMPDVRFRIIGRGPEREKLQHLIKDQRLEDCVSISDAVPIEQIAEVMANTDLGIVPKRKDSFGNEAFSTKIMEFMAMGVPVVASDTRIDRYYFNDDLVQFCESGNAEDFAAKIVELARSPEKRDALRSSATRFIEQNNWDVKKYEYLDLVDHLLGGRRYVHDPQDAQSTSPVL